MQEPTRLNPISLVLRVALRADRFGPSVLHAIIDCPRGPSLQARRPYRQSSASAWHRRLRQGVNDHAKDDVCNRSASLDRIVEIMAAGPSSAAQVQAALAELRGGLAP